MSRLRLLSISVIIAVIALLALYQRDKTIRTEQLTAQYNLGYRTAENDLMKAAMAEGRRATNTFNDTHKAVRVLPDDDLTRRARNLGILCHGDDC